MRGLLSDVNAGGYLKAILFVCLSHQWREVWLALKVPVFSFDDFGLDSETTDDRVWDFCQQNLLILFTDNRNEADPTSLGRAIKEKGTADSLPVLTPGDAQRLLSDRTYAEQAAERMIEILMDIEDYRGTGRMYVPREA